MDSSVKVMDDKVGSDEAGQDEADCVKTRRSLTGYSSLIPAILSPSRPRSLRNRIDLRLRAFQQVSAGIGLGKGLLKLVQGPFIHALF